MRTVFGILWVLAFLTAFPARAQRSSDWRTFKASDGLAESFVTSVAVSQRSNVWVKHFEASSLSVLNGYKTKTIPAPDRGAYRIHESRSGQIWAAHAEGIQEYRDGMWIQYPIPEVRREFQTNVLRNARSIPLVPLKQGRILLLLSDRLMEFSNEWAPEFECATLLQDAQTHLGRFTDLTMGRDGTLWILGDHGLLRLTNGIRVAGESRWEEFLLPAEGLRDLQQAFPDDSGGLTAVAGSEDGGKVIVHFDGDNWTMITPPNPQIRQAWKGPDGRFWALSITSLLHQEENGSWATDSDVPANQFFDVATEANGVFWLATSEGLLRHSPALWQSPSHLKPNNGFVRSIGQRPNGAIWIASTEGITLNEKNYWQSYPFPEGIEQPFQPGEFTIPLPDGRLVSGFNGKLLIFNPTSQTYKVAAHPSGKPIKLLGTLGQGNLCVQVLTESERVKLEAFDGVRFSEIPFPAPPIAGTGLLQVFITSSTGELWLGTDSGLFQFTDGKWQAHDEDEIPVAVTCLAELSNGRIWAGTRESIWEFDGKNWSLVRLGFDRVNTILTSRDGSVWVASNSGLFRCAQEDWIEYSVQDGLPANAITDVFEDRGGKLWAGTMRGPSIFTPRADMTSPRSFITGLETKEEGEVTISFNGVDKWKVTPSEQLLFSYRLDEKEWSPFTSQRRVSFHGLSAGTHYFQVRAMDRNRNIDPQPALLDFEVSVPWYQETRLVLILLAGLGTALFFAGLAFNRHRQLLRSYAEVEQIVTLRTRQLEQAHAQLLHSQKMTALGTLAAGVAHDFNSILSIIKGSVQIIETNLNDREKINLRVNRIKTAVEQGSEVVKAMLGLARPDEDARNSVDLEKVFSDTTKFFVDRFGNEIQVVTHSEKDLPEIFSSPNLIQQILLNFLFNAADAVDDEGRIGIRARLMNQLPDELVLVPRTAARYVAISVEDTGCGIAPEMLPRIFEPFYTSKSFSSRRGTGLGLSMVYELARELSCGLAVQSTVGQGSTFTLIIPAGKILKTTETRDGAKIPLTSDACRDVTVPPENLRRSLPQEKPSGALAQSEHSQPPEQNRQTLER